MTTAHQCSARGPARTRCTLAAGHSRTHRFEPEQPEQPEPHSPEAARHSRARTAFVAGLIHHSIASAEVIAVEAARPDDGVLVLSHPLLSQPLYEGGQPQRFTYELTIREVPA